MKSLILFSGGVDSTTALALSLSRGEEVTAISIKYGQNHSEMELSAARKITDYYKVKHEFLDLTSIFKESHSSLSEANDLEIPKGDYSDHSNQTTEIEFRNGVFLAILASLAQQMGADKIYFGAHQDDSGTIYPDCSPEFISSMGKAIWLGTGQRVKLGAPFQDMTKADIVSKGIELNVPYHLTYSCYEGSDPACGECGTCIDRKKAFSLNGLEDL